MSGTKSLASSGATSGSAIQAPSLWHDPHHGAENQTKTNLAVRFARLLAALEGRDRVRSGAWCGVKNLAILAESNTPVIPRRDEVGDWSRRQHLPRGRRVPSRSATRRPQRHAVLLGEVEILVEIADVDVHDVVLVGANRSRALPAWVAVSQRLTARMSSAPQLISTRMSSTSAFFTIAAIAALASAVSLWASDWSWRSRGRYDGVRNHLSGWNALAAKQNQQREKQSCHQLSPFTATLAPFVYRGIAPTL